MPLIVTFSLGEDSVNTKYDLGSLLVSDTNINLEACYLPVPDED